MSHLQAVRNFQLLGTFVTRTIGLLVLRFIRPSDAAILSNSIAALSSS